MMKSDRNLNQTLPKFLFRGWRFPPNVFEHFMGLEELAAVEQLDSDEVIFFMQIV